jgi:hypothetical protein
LTDTSNENERQLSADASSWAPPACGELIRYLMERRSAGGEQRAQRRPQIIR